MQQLINFSIYPVHTRLFDNDWQAVAAAGLYRSTRRPLRHRLADLLTPGGWLVFGINDWPFHLPEAQRDWCETPQGIELLEVLPDRAAMTCTDLVTLVWPDGQREQYALTRRHYYLPELHRLLADAGFSLHGAFHRLAGQAYDGSENGLFIYARKGSR
jgi:hypothetical protein